MKDLAATPRWPLYDKRCREWTVALKQLHGEFRRGRGEETQWGITVGMLAATGAWLIWATIVGVFPSPEPPFEWLVPAEGAALLALALLMVRKMFGVRYRFMHGDVCEISIGGHVRWREPLATLESVTFPWRSRGPQMLTLHWSTQKRTIELFSSIEAAVGDVLRARRNTLEELGERPWRCEQCGEENPESFDVCWKCGAAANGIAR